MKPLLPIIGLLLAGATTLAAQPAKDFQAGSASIRGQVTDPSGKSIPDAIVSLSNGQGASRGVKSDVQGQYQVRNVDPGTYTVRASAKLIFYTMSAEVIHSRLVAILKTA